MSNFNFFQRPYTTACVDDDKQFLDLLALALPSEWQVTLHQRTQSMCDCLRQASAERLLDFAQLKQALQTDLNETSTILKVLQYWHRNPQRWAIAQLAIVDYAMPKMTGLQVLTQVPEWRGRNILLTGVADEVAAVAAFNQGLIQQYIPKQSDDLMAMVLKAVARVQPHIFESEQLLCEAQLSAPQLKALMHPDVRTFLNAFSKAHWIECLVIAQPFGVLALSSDGAVSWLQLEFVSDMADLTDIAKVEDWGADAWAAIQAGTHLSNSLLRQALGSQIPPSLAKIIPIGESPLATAHFEFTVPSRLQANASYAQWFREHASRTVRT